MSAPPNIKAIDIHPHQPWIAATSNTGELFVWNYLDKVLLKYIRVLRVPSMFFVGHTFK